MTCENTHRLLDAWLDGELDPATRDDIGTHIAACPACAARRDERERLHDAIRRALPRHDAPPGLRGAVRASLSRHMPRPAPPARRGPSWGQAAGLALIAAACAAGITFTVLRGPATDTLREQAVASHASALASARGQPESLVQVAASDRHVVGPWFQGRIDVAPPVRDLATDGFTLLGGRLDHVGSRKAAVVVYRIRNHPIDLFVWRAERPGDEPPESTSHRGFSTVTWSGGGLHYAAVSDVDPHDLARFAERVRAAP